MQACLSATGRVPNGQEASHPGGRGPIPGDQSVPAGHRGLQVPERTSDQNPTSCSSQLVTHWPPAPPKPASQKDPGSQSTSSSCSSLLASPAFTPCSSSRFAGAGPAAPARVTSAERPASSSSSSHCAFHSTSHLPKLDRVGCSWAARGTSGKAAPGSRPKGKSSGCKPKWRHSACSALAADLATARPGLSRNLISSRSSSGRQATSARTSPGAGGPDTPCGTRHVPAQNVGSLSCALASRASAGAPQIDSPLGATPATKAKSASATPDSSSSVRPVQPPSRNSPLEVGEQTCGSSTSSAGSATSVRLTRQDGTMAECLHAPSNRAANGCAGPNRHSPPASQRPGTEIRAWAGGRPTKPNARDITRAASATAAKARRSATPAESAMESSTGSGSSGRYAQKPVVLPSFPPPPPP